MTGHGRDDGELDIITVHTYNPGKEPPSHMLHCASTFTPDLLMLPPTTLVPYPHPVTTVQSFAPSPGLHHHHSSSFAPPYEPNIPPPPPPALCVASPCIFSDTLTFTSKNLATQRSRQTDSPLLRSDSR